jgi:hypothetical protein
MKFDAIYNLLEELTIIGVTYPTVRIRPTEEDVIEFKFNGKSLKYPVAGPMGDPSWLFVEEDGNFLHLGVKEYDFYESDFVDQIIDILRKKVEIRKKKIRHARIGLTRFTRKVQEKIGIYGAANFDLKMMSAAGFDPIADYDQILFMGAALLLSIVREKGLDEDALEIFEDVFSPGRFDLLAIGGKSSLLLKLIEDVEKL